jgi:two-component system, OmpR family, sensor histidine kinase SenX3
MKNVITSSFSVFHFPFSVFGFMRSFPIFLVASLFVLLGVLAYLQYAWLGQISDGERERLQRNLKADTQRFADDFNREIQNAYFNFQIDADGWREKNSSEFNERYKFWSEKTAYPNLVKDFYFVELKNEMLWQFKREKKAFEAAQWTENLDKLKPTLAAESFEPVTEEIPALLMPVNEAEQKTTRILVRTPNTENIIGAPSGTPEKYGVLIIELDENTIKTQLLPDLVKKYFSQNESANYKLAITNKDNQTIFQTENLTATDASAKLFEFSPDNFIFFTNREILSTVHTERRKTIVLSKTESQTTENNSAQNSNRRIEMQMTNNEKPRVRIFESNKSENDSAWTLNVQHTAGSLEQFITNTRRRNLAVSFGILSLLGISVGLIFLSALRAKLFAQRQVDFVSSVSHELRTPLAVIYSAGENLADGVTKEQNQVARYGDLIKGEGRKLSKMVEQILDFAGADSGKKKYDRRETNVAEIIENALAECRSLLDEKEFKIEKNIAENLPPISADKTALSQAIQNLIVNSVKYSSGEKHLKISANNGGGRIKITVEDKGIGIAPKDLKHIFEPFYRAKAVVDEQIHGNGLGLSLVRQTIEAHGGKISVESEIGKGSKFTIILTQNKGNLTT